MANSPFVITFTGLPSIPQTAQSLTYKLLCGGILRNGQIAASDCSGNTCIGQAPTVPAGSCDIKFVRINNGDAISVVVAGTGSNSFDVSPSPQTPGTPTGSGNRCCVTEKPPGQFSYRDIPGSISIDQCTADGGITEIYRCGDGQLENRYCNTFCSKQSRTTGSCIYTSSTNAQYSNTYQNVCRQGELCQCGGTAGQNYQYGVECPEACVTGTASIGTYNPAFSSQQTSFPIGQCTDTQGYQGLLLAFQIGTQSGVTGTQYVQQPRILSGPNGGRGLYQCQPHEYCVCTYISLSSFTANNNRPSTPILPGTKTWDDPADISDRAPTAAPNDRICDQAAADATITATLSLGAGTSSNSNLRLIQAGDTVTITGSVGKLADTCKGYTYTCRREKVVGCDVKNRVLWTTLDYKDCPAGLPEIVHEDGDGKNANWGMIASIAIIAATWGATTPLTPLAGKISGIDALFYAGVAGAVDAFADGSRCSSGAPNANYAPMIYNGIYQTARIGGNQQTTPGQPAGTLSTCNNCLADSGGAATWLCLVGGNQDLGYCLPVGPCPPGTTQKMCLPDITVTTSQYGTCNSCVEAGKTWCQNSGCQNSEISCPGERFTSIPAGCPTGTGAATAKPTFDITGRNVLPGNPFQTPSALAPTVAQSGVTAAGSSSASGYLAGQIASSILGQLPTCPSPEELSGCFRVCGKTYETEASRAPTCTSTVLAYKEAAYKCGQGSCGGFAGKRVRVQIKDPGGAVVIDDTTTADANGEFSYTFAAPAADGEFTAVVSVPK